MVVLLSGSVSVAVHCACYVLQNSSTCLLCVWSVGVRKLRREAKQIKLCYHRSTSGWVEDFSSVAVNGVAVEELKAFKGKLIHSVNPCIKCPCSHVKTILERTD